MGMDSMGRITFSVTLLCILHLVVCDLLDRHERRSDADDYLSALKSRYPINDVEQGDGRLGGEEGGGGGETEEKERWHKERNAKGSRRGKRNIKIFIRNNGETATLRKVKETGKLGTTRVKYHDRKMNGEWGVLRFAHASKETGKGLERSERKEKVEFSIDDGENRGDKTEKKHHITKLNIPLQRRKYQHISQGKEHGRNGTRKWSSSQGRAALLMGLGSGHSKGIHAQTVLTSPNVNSSTPTINPNMKFRDSEGNIVISHHSLRVSFKDSDKEVDKQEKSVVSSATKRESRTFHQPSLPSSHHQDYSNVQMWTSARALWPDVAKSWKYVNARKRDIELRREKRYIHLKSMRASKRTGGPMTLLVHSRRLGRHSNGNNNTTSNIHDYFRHVFIRKNNNTDTGTVDHTTPAITTTATTTLKTKKVESVLNKNVTKLQTATTPNKKKETEEEEGRVDKKPPNISNIHDFFRHVFIRKNSSNIGASQYLPTPGTIGAYDVAHGKVKNLHRKHQRQDQPQQHHHQQQEQNKLEEKQPHQDQQQQQNLPPPTKITGKSHNGHKKKKGRTKIQEVHSVSPPSKKIARKQSPPQALSPPPKHQRHQQQLQQQQKHHRIAHRKKRKPSHRGINSRVLITPTKTSQETNDITLKVKPASTPKLGKTGRAYNKTQSQGGGSAGAVEVMSDGKNEKETDEIDRKGISEEKPEDLEEQATAQAYQTSQLLRGDEPVGDAIHPLASDNLVPTYAAPAVSSEVMPGVYSSLNTATNFNLSPTPARIRWLFGNPNFNPTIANMNVPPVKSVRPSLAFLNQMRSAGMRMGTAFRNQNFLAPTPLIHGPRFQNYLKNSRMRAPARLSMQPLIQENVGYAFDESPTVGALNPMNARIIHERHLAELATNRVKAGLNPVEKKNLVQFRDHNGKVLATLRDPNTWNSANVTLSKDDDKRRYMNEWKEIQVEGAMKRGVSSSGGKRVVASSKQSSAMVRTLSPQDIINEFTPRKVPIISRKIAITTSNLSSNVQPRINSKGIRTDEDGDRVISFHAYKAPLIPLKKSDVRNTNAWGVPTTVYNAGPGISVIGKRDYIYHHPTALPASLQGEGMVKKDVITAINDIDPLMENNDPTQNKRSKQENDIATTDPWKAMEENILDDKDRAYLVELLSNLGDDARSKIDRMGTRRDDIPGGKNNHQILTKVTKFMGDVEKFIKNVEIISSTFGKDPQIFSKVIKFIVHVEKFIGDLETIVTKFSNEGEEKREEKRRIFLEKLRSIVHQEDVNNASLIALLRSNSSLSTNDSTTQLHRVMLLPKSLFNETLSFLKDEVNEIENVQKILQRAGNKTQSRNHTKNIKSNENKTIKLSTDEKKLTSESANDKIVPIEDQPIGNLASFQDPKSAHNDNEDKTFFVTQLNDHGKAAADGEFNLDTRAAVNLTSNSNKSEGNSKLEDKGDFGLQDLVDHQNTYMTPFNTSTEGKNQLISQNATLGALSEPYNESIFLRELNDAEHALDELSHKANTDRARYLKTYLHGAENENLREMQRNMSGPLVQYGKEDSKDDVDEDEELPVNSKKNNTTPTEGTSASTRAKKSFEPTSPKKIDVNIVLNVSTNTPSVMLNPILYNERDLHRRMESVKKGEENEENEKNETHIVLTTQKFKESLNDAILLFAHRLRLLNFTHGIERVPIARRNFSYIRNCEKKLQCSYNDTHNTMAPGQKTNITVRYTSPLMRDGNKTVSSNTSTTRHIYKYQSPQRLHAINNYNNESEKSGAKPKLHNDTKINASVEEESKESKESKEGSNRNDTDSIEVSELTSQLKTNINLSSWTSPHIIHLIDSEAAKQIPRAIIRPLVSACKHQKCAVVPLSGNMESLRLFETFFRTRKNVSGEVIEAENAEEKHVDTASTRQYDGEDLLLKSTKNNGTIFDEVSPFSSDSSDDDDIDDSDNRTTTVKPEPTIPTIIKQNSIQLPKDNYRDQKGREKNHNENINYRDLRKAVSYGPDSDFQQHINTVYYFDSAPNDPANANPKSPPQISLTPSYFSVEMPQQFSSDKSIDYNQNMENKVEIVADNEKITDHSKDKLNKTKEYSSQTSTEKEIEVSAPSHPLSFHRLNPPHNPSPTETIGENVAGAPNLKPTTSYEEHAKSIVSDDRPQQLETSSWQPGFPANAVEENTGIQRNDPSFHEASEEQPETFMNAVRPASNTSFYFTQGRQYNSESLEDSERKNVSENNSEQGTSKNLDNNNNTSQPQDPFEGAKMEEKDHDNKPNISQNDTETQSTSPTNYDNKPSKTSIDEPSETSQNYNYQNSITSINANDTELETSKNYQVSESLQNYTNREPETTSMLLNISGTDDNMTITINNAEKHVSEQNVHENDLERFVNESKQPETVENAIKALAGITQLPTSIEEAPQPMTQKFTDMAQYNDGSETPIISQNANKENIGKESKKWGEVPELTEGKSLFPAADNERNESNSLKLLYPQPPKPFIEKPEISPSYPQVYENVLPQTSQVPLSMLNEDSENLLPSSRLTGTPQAQQMHGSNILPPSAQINPSKLGQMKKERKDYYCRDRPCFSINDIWKMFHCDHPPCFKNFFSRLRHQSSNSTLESSLHFNQTKAAIKLIGKAYLGPKLVHNTSVNDAQGDFNNSTMGRKKKEYYCANRPCFSINDIWRMLQCDRPPCHKEMFTRNSTLWYKQMYENDTSIIENLLKNHPDNSIEKSTNHAVESVPDNKPLREMFMVHRNPNVKPVHLLNMSQDLGTPSECFCPNNMLDEDCKRHCRGQMVEMLNTPFSSVMNIPLKQIEEQHSQPNTLILPAIQKLEDELQRGPFSRLNMPSMTIPPSENKTTQGDTLNKKMTVCRSWTFIPQFRCLSHSGDANDDISGEYKHQYSNCHALPYAPYVKCYGNNLNAAAEKIKMAKKRKELHAFLKATDSTRDSTLKAIKAVENAGALHFSNLENARVNHVQGPSIGGELNFEKKMTDDVAVAMLENANKDRQRPSDITSLLTKSPSADEKLGSNHIVLSLTKNSNGEGWRTYPTPHLFETPETRVTKKTPLPPATSTPPNSSLSTTENQRVEGKRKTKNNTKIEFKTYVNHLFSQDKAKANLFRKILHVMMTSPVSNSSQGVSRDPWEFVYPALKWVDKYETVWKPNFKGSQPRFILKRKFRRKGRKSSWPVVHKLGQKSTSHNATISKHTPDYSRIVNGISFSNRNQYLRHNSLDTIAKAKVKLERTNEKTNFDQSERIREHKIHPDTKSLGTKMKRVNESISTGTIAQSVRSEQLRYSRKPFSEGDGTKVRTVTTSHESAKESISKLRSIPNVKQVEGNSTGDSLGTNLIKQDLIKNSRSNNAIEKPMVTNTTLNSKNTGEKDEVGETTKESKAKKTSKPAFIETIAYPDPNEDEEGGSGSDGGQKIVWKGDIHTGTNRKLNIMWKPVKHRHRHTHPRKRRRYRLSSKKGDVPMQKSKSLTTKEIKNHLEKLTNKDQLARMAMSLTSDINSDEQKINKLGFSAPRSEDVTVDDLQPSKLD